MRVSSGIDGFDRLVDGGLPAGRLCVVTGPPGSGKTTFGAQFVTEGVANGETCLYISMHETREGIKEDMSGFSFGFERAIETERLKFLDAFSSNGSRFFGNPGANGRQNDAVNRLTSFIDSQGIDRVVIDSAMLLGFLFDDDDATTIQVLSALKRTDATSLLVAENTEPDAYATEQFLAHGVVFLHNYLEDGEMQRGIQVLKMRGTDIDTDIHELSFGTDGIRIGERRKIPQGSQQ